MRIFRIADGRRTLWDGAGAALLGGRWNSPGRPVIYGSLSYAGAMLEVLAHARLGLLPETHRYVIAEVPGDVPLERHDADSLPAGWDAENSLTARAFGDCWLAEQRSAILLVPSVVARLEWNALVNPAHPDVAKIRCSKAERVNWDRRLFGTAPPAGL